MSILDVLTNEERCSSV